MMRRVRFCLLAAGLGCLPAMAAEGADLRETREKVFAFAEKPEVRLRGDRVTITFASKGRCDVTVAIEDAKGRIIRHLACGLLGPKAPPPLKRDSLKQELVWDGKDDAGRYIDDKESCTVRVSLGLKARFERTLYWSPERRSTSHKYSERHSPAVAAAPEGVYVYEGGVSDQLRLFDHEGNYVRTVYPFPGGKLKETKGLKWVAFPPDGLKVPFKGNREQNTLLTCGTSMSKALAVRGERIALADTGVNWLAADGTTGGKELGGPEVTFPVKMGRVHSFPGGLYHYGPRSMALSPDGKWLYMTNYRWGNSWREGILAGVARLAVDGGEKPEVFLGTMKKLAHGKKPGEFHSPSSVDCDAKGRVYVSDFHNDRIQVFTPEGKFAKSIKVTRPGLVRVHRRTGEIFAFSWSMTSCYSPELEHKGEAALTRFGPLEKPDVRETYSLKGAFDRVRNDWALARADVDVWADPPKLWVAKTYVRVFAMGGGKLELVKSFRDEAKERVTRAVAPRHGRQRLYFNPRGRRLYVGAHQDPAVIHAKGFYQTIEVNPDSGKLQPVALP
ncbi:MAG: NHL repeat-containing protein, partial [Planctomycetota bacterium]